MARNLFRVNARGNAISGVNISRDANNRGTWPVRIHGRMSRKSLSETLYRARAIRARAHGNVCAAFIGANAYVRYVRWTFLLSRVWIVMPSHLRPFVRCVLPRSPPSDPARKTADFSGEMDPGENSVCLSNVYKMFAQALSRCFIGVKISL